MIDDLFTSAYARAADPETSHQAAESVKATALEDIVLQELKRMGERGATTHELSAALGMSLVTVSPRLRPLANKGLAIETTGRRPGPSGRNSIVWRAAWIH